MGRDRSRASALRLIGALLAAMIAAMTLKATPAHARPDWHARIVEAGLATTKFDPFLAALLEAYPIAGAARVNLRPVYDPEAINVLVVDTAKIEALEKGGGRAPIAAHQLYLNGLAVQPRLMLLDSDFLRLILMTAVIRQDAVLNRAHPSPETERANPIAALELRMVVDDVRRGELVEAFRTQSADREVWRERTDDLLATPQVDSADRRAVMPGDFRALAPAFVPLLAHEFAHLDGNAIFLSRNPIDMFRSLVTSETRREEERADNVAFAVVEPMIRKLAEDFVREQGRPESLIAFRAIQSLVSFALLQRDQVLYRVFGEFRGYKYQDAFYALYHKPCPAPEPVARDYLAFENVTAGHRDPLPTLTQEEYGRLAQSLDPAAFQTHVHGFERAARLLDVVRKASPGAQPFEGAREVEQFLTLLDHVRGKVKIVAAEPRPGETLDLSVDAFLRALDTPTVVYRHERAVLCHYPECYVLTPLVAEAGAPGTSYIEVWASQGRVIRIKYRSPMSASAIDEIKANPNQQVAVVDAYMVQLVSMLKFGSAAAQPHAFPESDAQRLIGQLRTSRLMCGTGQTGLELADRIMVGRTTLTGDALEMIVGPRPGR